MDNSGRSRQDVLQHAQKHWKEASGEEKQHVLLVAACGTAPPKRIHKSSVPRGLSSVGPYTKCTPASPTAVAIGTSTCAICQHIRSNEMHSFGVQTENR